MKITLLEIKKLILEAIDDNKKKYDIDMSKLKSVSNPKEKLDQTAKELGLDKKSNLEVEKKKFLNNYTQIKNKMKKTLQDKFSEPMK